MLAQNANADKVKSYPLLSQLIPAHWQSGEITTSAGGTIHYTRTGDAAGKPSLLLLHGVQMNGLSWLRTAQALEADYDVIMPDARGHGQSARAGEDISVQMMVNDLIDLIRELALENPFVIGHSMGAELAGRLATAHPIRGLVLVDPSLVNFYAMMNFDMANPPAWFQPVLERMRALKSQTHEDRMVSGLGFLPPGADPTAWHEADYVSFVDGHADFDPNFYNHELGYLFEQPDIIQQITCPTLLLTARPMMPGANVDAGLAAYTDNLPDGAHILVEDSGHFIMADQFERFITLVRKFMNAH